MRVRGICCAVILAILGGCGGSDNDDAAAVSPPPAAPGETPAPAAPAPVPPDAPAPPDASPPPDAPPPPQSRPPIRGDVLIAALSLESYSGAAGDVVVAGRRFDYPSTSTSVEQRAFRDSPDSQAPGGRYLFNSSGYMNRGPFIQTRHDLAAAYVSGTWAMSGAGSTSTFTLAEQIEANGSQGWQPLTKPGGLVVSAAQAYELGQTLAQWTAQAADGTWQASLQIQPDYADDLFRVCWRVEYPARRRTSCGVFGTEQGDLRGAHVVDDSQAMGALTWRSNLPPAPPGALPDIGGEVLIKALSLARYSDPVAGAAVGLLVSGTPTTSTFVEQRVDADDPQTPAGHYAFESGGYMNQDPSLSPRFDLRRASVTGHWTLSGSGTGATLALGDQIEGYDAQETLSLPHPGGLTIAAGQRYVLDDTLAHWTRTEAPIYWNASLQIHSDEVPDWFRLCWEMSYTEVYRQSCGLFSRQTGDLTGVYVVDSLHGAAPLVWRSTEMPQAASSLGRRGSPAPGGNR